MLCYGMRIQWYAMLWDVNALLWEINAMLCYGAHCMLWKLCLNWLHVLILYPPVYITPTCRFWGSIVIFDFFFASYRHFVWNGLSPLIYRKASMTSSTVAFLVPMKLYSFCIATSVLLSDFDTLYLFFLF